MGLVSAITSCTLRTPDLQVLELAAELFDTRYHGPSEIRRAHQGMQCPEGGAVRSCRCVRFIFLQSECFQCAARQVAGSGAELNGQVGGDFNRQVHVEL